LSFREVQPMTTKQAARMLGVSESTVRRMADRGELEAERGKDGRRLYRRDGVRTFQQAQTDRIEPAYCDGAERTRMSPETLRGLMAGTGMIFILMTAYLSGHPGQIQAILNEPLLVSLRHLIQPLDYR
jgi:excisionase family DNA binding protein